MKTFPGKIFDLTNSLNITGLSQKSVELKNNIKTLCEVAVLGDSHEIPGDLIIGSDLLSERQVVINLKDKLLHGAQKYILEYRDRM